MNSDSADSRPRHDPRRWWTEEQATRILNSYDGLGNYKWENYLPEPVVVFRPGHIHNSSADEKEESGQVASVNYYPFFDAYENSGGGGVRGTFTETYKDCTFTWVSLFN